MMKKTFFIFIFIFLLVISVSYGASVWNYLTRGMADKLYCRITGCKMQGDINLLGHRIFNGTVENITAITSNSSSYWDNLDTPADINAGDITDDGTYLTYSVFNESNTTIARIGSCPHGYVVQNTTVDGVDCVQDATGGGGGSSSVDDDMYLNLESSNSHSVLWNITKSDVKDYNLRVRSGRHFAFGGTI